MTGMTWPGTISTTSVGLSPAQQAQQDNWILHERCNELVHWLNDLTSRIQACEQALREKEGAGELRDPCHHPRSG